MKMKNEKWKCEKKSKKWKMNKAKEEKGFLHKEVIQVNLPGCWSGSPIVERFLCSYVTLPGYCLGLLVAEQHHKFKLKLWVSYGLFTNIPLIPIETTMLAWLGMCADQPRSWRMLHLRIRQVWKPRWINNWTILLEVLDLLFMNKIHLKSWSSTSVSPSVVVATTTCWK